MIENQHRPLQGCANKHTWRWLNLDLLAGRLDCLLNVIQHLHFWGPGLEIERRWVPQAGDWRPSSHSHDHHDHHNAIVIMIMIMIIISLTRCGPWMKMGPSSWSLQILLWGAPSMQAALTGNTFETVEIFLNKYSFNKMAKQGHENIWYFHLECQQLLQGMNVGLHQRFLMISIDSSSVQEIHFGWKCFWLQEFQVCWELIKQPSSRGHRGLSQLRKQYL